MRRRRVMCTGHAAAESSLTAGEAKAVVEGVRFVRLWLFFFAGRYGYCRIFRLTLYSELSGHRGSW